MEKRSAIAQQFIDSQINAALTRAGLSHGHPIRDVLDSSAEIVGTRDACVRVDDGSSLDDRIQELRGDPRFRASFPNAPKVVRSDIEKMRVDFQQIANGTIVVE